ncbi:hypothetical protein CDAR_318641 [Caerostris darwini]|uniref:Uncharacterized protein n=1 Tax=Caerostris darwini TaxID=1538125 RepID=A0AAV4Q9D3_9ARAC|nr:hypothetical protein CDAR_318641 [Caerostris darwini]
MSTINYVDLEVTSIPKHWATWCYPNYVQNDYSPRVCVPSQDCLKTLWGVGSPKHLSVSVQPSFRKHSRDFLCGRLQMCSEPLDQNIFAGEHTTEFPKWMSEGFSEHRHCK